MKKVTAAILIKDGLFFIAKRKKADKLANKWEFPGGKIENGETAEQCLKREIEEELRINVRIGDFFGESIYQYPHGAIKLLAYLVHWESGSIELMAHDEYKWVSLEELDYYDFAPADIPLVKKLKERKKLQSINIPDVFF
ncbi:MAG: 8-oxo-dGTP diphosphatase MutT (plasmid) [Candidatus Methanoperedens sp.]|nr:MAG: 8-oxo-dGTP diphosphatase MutT [Candidatus Methanoperedens sp.]